MMKIFQCQNYSIEGKYGRLEIKTVARITKDAKKDAADPTLTTSMRHNAMRHNSSLSSHFFEPPAALKEVQGRSRNPRHGDSPPYIYRLN